MSAIDVVVQLARLRDGRRVAWEIATVGRTSRGEPIVEPVFRFEPRDGAQGAPLATGLVPDAAGILRERGEALPTALFDDGVDA